MAGFTLSQARDAWKGTIELIDFGEHERDAPAELRHEGIAAEHHVFSFTARV
jgi:hypothetical protein